MFLHICSSLYVLEQICWQCWHELNPWLHLSAPSSPGDKFGQRLCCISDKLTEVAQIRAIGVTVLSRSPRGPVHVLCLKQLCKKAKILRLWRIKWITFL